MRKGHAPAGVSLLAEEVVAKMVIALIIMGAALILILGWLVDVLEGSAHRRLALARGCGRGIPQPVIPFSQWQARLPLSEVFRPRARDTVRGQDDYIVVTLRLPDSQVARRGDSAANDTQERVLSMTRNRDAVARMETSGENYTTALRAVTEQPVPTPHFSIYSTEDTDRVFPLGDTYSMLELGEAEDADYALAEEWFASQARNADKPAIFIVTCTLISEEVTIRRWVRADAWVRASWRDRLTVFADDSFMDTSRFTEAALAWSCIEAELCWAPDDNLTPLPDEEVTSS
jgi:hypothetical protein